MKTGKTLLALGLIVVLSGFALAQGPVTLLNVSYDPTRELYQDYQRGLCQILEGKDRRTTSPSSNRTAARASRRAR